MTTSGQPEPKPPARRTFAARTVTRATLVLLVSAVLLTALVQHLRG